MPRTNDFNGHQSEPLASARPGSLASGRGIMRGYASTEEGDGSADGEEETVMLADVHSSHSSAVSPKQCWPLQRRVLLAVMGCLMWALCYADRTNISLAIVPMSTVFGYSEATQGLILSSFFAGYVCTQVLGGWLALKIGAPDFTPKAML
eukprot:SAG31_NODE_2673_length_5268_cov_2.551944_8_plen_150_part_00